MLQDEGNLNVADLAVKYLPEFANLKTPSGKPANLTITQLLTHTSGLGEAGAAEAKQAHALADLVPIWLAAPMQYEPGTKWKYTQSGINAAARTRNRPQQGNGGLYSTPRDYARFCQMLLSSGMLDGHRYLSADAMKFLSTPQTGDLPTGFFQNEGRGANYGWGIGTSILRLPHEGVAAMLAPGTFGHGGAWGMQAWIDPVKGVAYVLMVQRANFPNSDASDVRSAFQKAAANALGK